MKELPQSTAGRFAGDLSRRQFFFIIAIFWAYVTVSNVLYAYGMRTGVAHITDVPLFAPWNARVLQHLLLLPVLGVSYWASLRIRWRPVLVTIPLQLLLGVCFAALAYPAMIVAEVAVSDAEMHQTVSAHMPHAEPLWSAMWLASFVSFLPAYGFGLALVTGSGLYAQFRDSELKRTALEREWSAARLAALRMQLSPHTLFNLLHTIRGSIEWDPKGAQTMVVQLADLLRRLLNAGAREYSRLSDELQFVGLYLALQQRRFPDRLSYTLPAAGDVPGTWVPSLILQPLVENAVVHGLAEHQDPVAVQVTVRRAADSLILCVTNTVAAHRDARAEPSGGGAPAAVPADTEGIGLKNVRERLSVQFGGRASLTAGMRGAVWASEISLPEVHDS